MLLTLAPGRYYAGISRPWIVSQGMVRNAVAKLGGTGIQFHDRDVPLPVNPRQDPNYSDDWDEWIEASYSGPLAQTEQKQRWAWLVFVPGDVPAGVTEIPVTPPGPELPGVIKVPAPPATGRALVWVAGVGLVVVFVLHAHARRSYGRPY